MEILPGHRYRVYEDHGTPNKPSLKNETIVTLWQRGDTNRDGDVSFVDIARVVEQTLATAPQRALASLDDVFDSDRSARELAERLVSRYSGRG